MNAEDRLKYSPAQLIVYNAIKENPNLTCEMISFHVRSYYQSVGIDRNKKVSSILYSLAKKGLIVKSDVLHNNLARWSVK